VSRGFKVPACRIPACTISTRGDVFNFILSIIHNSGKNKEWHSQNMVVATAGRLLGVNKGLDRLGSLRDFVFEEVVRIDAAAEML